VVYKNTFFLKRLELFVNRESRKIIPQINQNFITLDIETQVLDKTISPIMVDIYDGMSHSNYFISDFNNVDEMMNTALNELLDARYHNHKIYVHNLSNFDGIFLLKYLLNLRYNGMQVFIEPVLKDGKFINLDLSFGKYKISFRDSYLILLFSLAKLAKTFNVGEKGEFKYNLVDNLNSNELVPFKQELMIYCKNDTKILYEIISKFNNLIFSKWSLNINNFPTLPSLAMGLFKSKYLRNEEVSVIKGKPYSDIRESYTGGSTDMFLPTGVNIYGYDINSLYPHSMAENDLPVNNMKYIECSNKGTIELNNFFGFCYADITTPDNLNIPILQIHHNNRTVSPLGKFTGWFFSEELKYGVDEFDYKVIITKGYSFDKANLFKSYVNDLYNLRLTYDKKDPMNYIAKILMNSLYGRFGLNPLLPDTLIIDKDSLDKFIDSSEIVELIEFEDKLLIQYIEENKIGNYDNEELDVVNNSNVAIASAITAYSRITMAKIKRYCLDNNIKIFYSDTDSVYTNKPLPDYLVGKELGKWKLEGFYEEGVFVAPKVYGLIPFR
jgi:hypothetical protein